MESENMVLNMLGMVRGRYDHDHQGERKGNARARKNAIILGRN